MRTKMNVFIGLFCLFLGGIPCLGECPRADLTGDCFVDLEDFAILADRWLNNMADFELMASQWLTGNRIPEDITIEARENVLTLIKLNPMDSNGNPITLSPWVVGLPKRASFDPQTNTLLWRPWYDQAGTYEIIIIDADSDYTQKITINIEDVPLKSWYQDWLDDSIVQSAMVEY
jgi:hypothetical protein